MPWVPIEESPLYSDWSIDTWGSAVINGSTITAVDDTEGWGIFYMHPDTRIRASFSSYAYAGDGLPPFFSVDTEEVHSSITDGFQPNPVELPPSSYIQFYTNYSLDDGEYLPADYEIFLEVWEGDDPDPDPDPDPDTLVAADDEATTNADTPVTVDVLANDTFNDEPVTLDQLDGPPTIDQQPANGTVSVAPDGKITYTPNPGFAGTDEFVYRIATPEPPEPSFICGFFGEGFAVISVPEGFSLDEPITFSVGDQSMEMHWVPWGGRWEPNYGGHVFYPQEGDLAVMSQDGNSVEGNLVRGFVLGNSGGQDWQVSPELPWFEFVVETEDGNTYYATESAFNAVSFPDGAPPTPPPGSPYPVKIWYQDEVGENEFCGLMVTPTD